ncbi:hypothetical protein EON65_47825 [archaeon]|nr:MAG: hypothetical protein EON65_47825 [archaeon]
MQGNSNKTKLKRVVATIRDGNHSVVDSFVSHKFVIRLARHREGVQTVFVKGIGDEVIHVYYDNFIENLYVHYIPPQTTSTTCSTNQDVKSEKTDKKASHSATQHQKQGKKKEIEMTSSSSISSGL